MSFPEWMDEQGSLPVVINHIYPESHGGHGGPGGQSSGQGGGHGGQGSGWQGHGRQEDGAGSSKKKWTPEEWKAWNLQKGWAEQPALGGENEEEAMQAEHKDAEMEQHAELKLELRLQKEETNQAMDLVASRQNFFLKQMSEMQAQQSSCSGMSWKPSTWRWQSW